jgi:hypothetical protein
MLGDIDLIFGIWVYNNELQIKFTFRSGPMIFGRVMALGFWNLAKYLVVTTFFRYAWRYWLDFFVCECMIISYRSALKFVPVEWFLANLQPLDFEIGQIFSCHHFISLWFEILTWSLVWECMIISYRSTLKFIPFEWFFCQLTVVRFWNFAKYLVVITFFSLWFEILTWFLVCEFKEAWGYRS